MISCPSRKAPRGLIFTSSSVLTAWEITWIYGDTKSLGANGIFAAFLAANIEQELKTKLPINMGFQGDYLDLCTLVNIGCFPLNTWVREITVCWEIIGSIWNRNSNAGVLSKLMWILKECSCMKFQETMQLRCSCYSCQSQAFSERCWWTWQCWVNGCTQWS